MKENSMKRPEFFARIAMCVFAVCLVTAVGCNRSSVDRHNLSGKVTFQGRPVPAGRIVFEPDAAKGNRGPQGITMIEDGQYSTEKFGKGAVAGALIVRIEGFEKPSATAATSENPDAVKPLFPTYITHIELGKEDSTFDFDVPATAATKR